MQSQGTGSLPPCPVCGADPSNRFWGEYKGYGYVLLGSKRHKVSGAQTTPLVCKVCGYVQIFVNPEDVRDEGTADSR